MPRTPRGGTRAGTPGTAYTNRTDLNQERSLPVRAVPGQTYGDRQAQIEAQRAVPMAPAPAPPSGPPQAPQPPQASPIPPGAFGDLHRPTERPFEPVTTGIASGPGAGPEVLPNAQGLTGNNLSATLAQIAQQSGSQAIRALAMHAQAAGS
jgi:hypothetical protein